MAYENLIADRRGGAGRITLNRPDKLNPLDWATVRELRAAQEAFDRDPGLRAVVVTGAGRAFSAGGDLDGYLELYRRPADFRHFLLDFFHLLEGIERSPKIWIAAVNGACVAGGLELLLACDLAVAANDARIGDGHLNFGQLPGAGGSQRLPRAIGALRAKELMFSGRLVDGTEAERIGLVNRAVAADALDAAVDDWVAGLAAKSPAGLKGAKHLVNQGLRVGLASGLQLELDFVHAYATREPDAMEGLAAFRDKRAPRFAGN